MGPGFKPGPLSVSIRPTALYEGDSVLLAGRVPLLDTLKLAARIAGHNRCPAPAAGVKPAARVTTLH